MNRTEAVRRLRSYIEKARSSQPSGCPTNPDGSPCRACADLDRERTEAMEALRALEEELDAYTAQREQDLQYMLHLDPPEGL